MAELKPCPFCGGNPTLRSQTIAPNGEFYYRIECRCCGAGTDWKYTTDGALESWNRRADDG